MMPEILTESFCERCGTRYTFESAAPSKTRRLGQIKTLSKGMKNWVMSDDTSLDEAMAAARNDDDRELTSHQLDAFHATFNFCMSCRQYTCGNCWNVAEGHCLTCAPHLGHEILPAPFPDQVPFEPIRIEAEAWPEVDLSAGAPANGNGNGNGAYPATLDPWASTGATDVEEILEIDPAARLAFLSGETPTPVIEPEAAPPPAAPIAASPSTIAPTPPSAPAPSTPPTAAGIFRWPTADEPRAADAVAPDAVADEPTPSAAADVAPEADVFLDGSVSAAAPQDAAPIADVAPGEDAVGSSIDEPPSLEGRTNLGATRTADLLRRFRPGQNIDAELAAYEAAADEAATAPDGQATEASAAPPEPQPEAIIASAATEVGVVPAEVEPVAAEPEPVAAVAPEPEPVAFAAPEPEPVALAAPEPQPEPVVADAPVEPEPVAAEAPAEPAPAPTPAPAPDWPAPASPPFPVDQPREDRIPQPTWQIFAPDAAPAAGRPLDGALPPVAPAQPPVAASADPQWPVRPDQIESPAMALLANRTAGSPSDALWAASAQEVLARPAALPAAGTTGVQPCSSCGLSLSATARFCRRCGTRQA